MVTPLRVAIIAALCGLAACARAPYQSQLEIPTTESGGGPERSVALGGRDFRGLIEPAHHGTVTGTATIVPGQAEGTFVASVALVGAAPGTYNWRIRVGNCGTAGALLGDRSDYPPVTVGSDGRGEASTTIGSEPPPAGGNYHVTIAAPAHATTRNLVACGDLLETGV
jgi:hypothetical protein